MLTVCHPLTIQVCQLSMDKHVFSNTQSNKVGGSYHMEKKGLQRVLHFLQQQGLTVEVLVTDRHM